MKELWQPVKGWETAYAVSNLGRVRSILRKVKYSDGRVYTYKSKVLSQLKDKNGYISVILSFERITKRVSVHRLVALAFISNPDNKPEVDHRNRIKSDNHVNNLRWVTSAENKTGEGGKKKLTDEQVREILSSSDVNKVLAERYSVSSSCITLIRKRINRRSI